MEPAGVPVKKSMT